MPKAKKNDILAEETKVKPEVTKPNVKKGVVSGCDKLRFRSNPSVSSDVIKLLDKGDVVEIIDSTMYSKFFEIKVGDIVGYVAKEYILVIAE